MTKLTIGFAGTPEFALPCLEAIQASSHTLNVVYTQPDRPAGRGRKMQASAVKQWALDHAIPVEQPLNFKSADSIAHLQALQLDVLVVIAYGLILPPAVLAAPRYGCLNVHASLLPRWRGASPIQHALLYGDHTSGITLMQMDKGMDTGPILLQSEYVIQPHETAASLFNALAHLAPDALMRILDTLPTCLESARGQIHEDATYAAKINKPQAAIQWHSSAEEIERTIRAFNPWPVTYTHYQEHLIRIHQAHILPHPSTQPPGTITQLDAQGLCISTGTRDLCITQLQLAGGKILSVAEWALNPRRLLDVGMRCQ